MRKKILFLTIISALSLLSAVPLLSAENQTHLCRYALLIGSNNGGRNRIPLLYAASDTQAVAEVLYEIGGLEKQNSIVSIDPSKKLIEQDFRRMFDMIRRGKSKNVRTEFFLYYSGHSDEEGLLLGNDRFTYKDLRNEMKSLDADVSIAILDSCASGAFIRIKGGKKVAPFLIDESSSMKGQVFLSSSSENEASQESDEIGASFFTHSLVSALRGAADFSRDGQVTINEAYQYARSETLARTENTLAGPQHPSWHIELTGTGDLILTDLRELDAGIVLTGELEGQIYIREGTDKLIAEIKKTRGMPVTLALPTGSYTITARTAYGTMEATLFLEKGTVASLSASQFSAAESVTARTRGTDPSGELTDKEFGEQLNDLVKTYIESKKKPETAKPGITERKTVPFSFSFLPGVGIPLGAPWYNVGLSLNLLIGVQYGIRGAEFGSIINIVRDGMYGAQFSGVGNIVGNHVSGFQGAGVFNIAGKGVRGAQAAGVFNIADGTGSWLQTAGVFNINAGPFNGAQLGGVFNIADDVKGMQGAGVFNIATGTVSGTQMSGVFNISGDMHGPQFSTINVCRDMDGAQFGVLNIGRNVTGIQVGVINIANELKGFPLGLINISRNGLVTLSAAGDFQGFYGFDFESGKTLYTTLAAGTRFSTLDTEPAFSGSAGLGLHFNLGPFFIEGDASAKTVFKIYGDPVTGYNDALPFPNFRLKGGLLLFKHIGGYVGLNAALHVEGMALNSFAHQGLSYSFTLADRTWTFYHAFIWGITIKF